MTYIEPVHDASVDLTITLAALPTSSTKLVGQQCTIVTTNGVSDFELAGKITVGTSPTSGKEICVHVFSIINDTPTYPDTMGASDAGVTLTSAAIKDSATHQAVRMATDATSNRAYSFSGISVAALFGGTVPKKWGVFVTHNTAVNLHATGGNHVLSVTPVTHQLV